MPTTDEILESLQFSHIQSAIPMNTTGSPKLTLTYQFAGNTEPGDAIWHYTGWTAFTEAEKDAVREALALVETFLNVDFVEVSGYSDPDFNFGLADMDPQWAGEGGAIVSGSQWDGQVVFNNTYDITGWGGMHVILHEIGHMLGLDHPFYDGDEPSKETLPADYDNSHYTLMSYNADPESEVRNDAMMIYDILALQDVWGAASHNTGNDTYDGRGGYYVRVIWDTDGTDTLDATSYDRNVKLDLRPGHFSQFGTYEDVAIAYDVKIEKAKGGSGNDKILGNGANNVLEGNGGSDKIKGFNSKDTIKGGSGGDALYGGGGKDKIYGGGGNDKIDGGGGIDYLWGKSGADKFIFRDGNGRDVIRDFADDVDIVKIKGEGSRSQVLDDATEVNGHVKFLFGDGDVLVVKNTTLDDLKDDLIVV